MFKSNSEGSSYGENLQFYGVTGKAGELYPLSPHTPSSDAYISGSTCKGPGPCKDFEC